MQYARFENDPIEGNSQAQVTQESPQDDSTMSGQKYKRTNFDDDDNLSTGGTPPGVTYDPAIAFKVGAGFWQRRTLLEKILLLFLVILILVIVILAALVATRQVYHFVPNDIAIWKGEEVCMTTACLTVASSIVNSMDTTVSPCDDFYEYACGGWVKDHPIPSGHSRWGTFGVMWKENQVVMKNELEKPMNVSHSVAEKKAKMYYRSCMDDDKTIQKLGARPLYELLGDLGGWNISSRGSDSAWSSTGWEFQEHLQNVHELGLSVFFNVWVGEDEKHSKTNVLQFDQDGLGLPREHYLNKTVEEDETLSALLKFMVDLGVLLGGDGNETEAQMTRVIEFEQEIANITVPQEERRDDEKLYHAMQIKDLQDIAPFIDWKSYINHLLSVTPYKVEDTENVVVFAPGYLKNLSNLVLETVKTDEGINTINNYMIWHVVKMMSSYLSKPFREAKKDFSEVLNGIVGCEEQWRYCTSDTDGILGNALGAMFVRETFHGESKKKAEQMITEIKTAFKRNLPRLEWMDKATRLAAVEKANAVVDMIGFPAYILNATELDKRFELLDIKDNEYFLNNLRDLRFNVKRNLDKLRKAPDRFSWSMSPPTVNAYYTATKNEIVFPAGILQAPFYDQQYPKSLNFGGMGVVMGHELTHGFDDEGREYDKTGILRPWWNKESIEKFKERTECMVDQYSQYSINGDHIKGKQTLGENIADNGGLKSAYHAYLDWTQENGQELPLPGLNLTHQQLFFVSFAQVWCSNTKPQADKMSILTDPHSPEKFRVIGTLSNSKEFSEQFQCKKGQKMNPTKKCEVW